MINKVNKLPDSESNIIRLTSNNDIIEVKIRPSLRSKDIKIRVSAFKGVELVLPKAANYNKAHKFLLNNEEWVIKQFNKIRKPALLAQNVIPVFGKLYNLSFNNDNVEPVILSDNDIIVSEKFKNNVNIVIENFLQTTIKNEIIEYAEKIRKALKVKYNKIKIKDPITRWGSCSISGTLMFSWRLIFAPKFIMEYVVAHELCHLIEMNHSDRFWGWVAKVYPDYKAASLWLKKNGQNLHCYLRKVK